jgi:hypothetical protein
VTLTPPLWFGLLSEVAGRDYHAAFQIAANEQFFEEQSRHNRFARARVVIVNRSLAQG